MKKGRKEFIAQLEEKFPEVYKNIEWENEGLMHLEMGTLAIETEEAIQMERFEAVETHFKFISSLLDDADPDLENAIFISYIEHVFLFQKEPNYLEARKLLPSNLMKGLIDMEDHFKDKSQN